jgi:L,D-peptidoglycan transpeptidase YkuD (ErfK/YbiS/YcfS/YnhG family)
VVAEPNDSVSSPIPKSATTLIVVASANWDETRGTLRRYSKKNGRWSLKEKIPVVLGRSGLAWGRGLHGEGAPAGLDGPTKKEGDGKSPAGVFWMRAAYGYDAEPPLGTKVRYRASQDTFRCVDDPSSKDYNQIVDEAVHPKTWTSAENLRLTSDAYRRLLVIEHNTSPTTPGGGSCIFLHVSSDKPTVGCTAMSLVRIESLMSSLDRDGAVIVQLPSNMLARLRSPWGLP